MSVSKQAEHRARCRSQALQVSAFRAPFREPRPGGRVSPPRCGFRTRRDPPLWLDCAELCLVFPAPSCRRRWLARSARQTPLPSAWSARVCRIPYSRWCSRLARIVPSLLFLHSLLDGSRFGFLAGDSPVRINMGQPTSKPGSVFELLPAEPVSSSQESNQIF